MPKSRFNPLNAKKREIPWWVWSLVIVVSPAIVIWRLLKRSPQDEAETQRIEMERLPARPNASTGGSGPESGEPPTETRSASPAVHAPAPPAGTIKGKTARKADNLRTIEGIGPKVAGLLQDAGIGSYTDLSQRSPDELRRILNEAGLYMIDPSTWPEQAKLAANGDFEALEQFQSELKGGRHKG